MPGYVGLQLSVELTKLLPIGPMIKSGAGHLWEFARSLRNSGSDIVVEKDLADVFGRALIEKELEQEFKDAVNIHRVVPLLDGAELELRSGPGPTVQRALRERDYMATIIQLSFLSWVQSRQNLSNLIVSSMTTRSNEGIGESMGIPSTDAIAQTLDACSSQTSAFNWSSYIEKVEQKLRKSVPSYHYWNSYSALSPSVFLGALDFLFMVQRFPEERRIMITNEIGSISMIVWAHYILGLTVAVKGDNFAPVVYGSRSIPHITIAWTNLDTYREPIGYEELGVIEHPEIILLDGTMRELIQCKRDDNDHMPVYSDERHPLRGWGRVYLLRLFNTDLLTSDEDPIYEEMVTLVAARALNMSQRLDQHIDLDQQTLGKSLNLEFWRVIEASRLIFDGIPVNKGKVNEYLSWIQDGGAEIADLFPIAFDIFIQKADMIQGGIGNSLSEELMIHVQNLVSFVVMFSFVLNVSDWGPLPLLMGDEMPGTLIRPTEMQALWRHPEGRKGLHEEDLFQSLASFLQGTSGIENGIDLISRGTFLYSDFGWSIFLDTERNKDPVETSAQLLHVVPGIPTNIRTQERKHVLRDGDSLLLSSVPNSFPMKEQQCAELKGSTGKTIKQTKYWASQRDQFQLTLVTTIEPSPTWKSMIELERPKIQYSTNPDKLHFEVADGIRYMHRCLWSCHLTKSCDHVPFEKEQTLLQSRSRVTEIMGVSTLKYYDPYVAKTTPFEHSRLVVIHTRGDIGLQQPGVVPNAL